MKAHSEIYFENESGFLEKWKVINHLKKKKKLQLANNMKKRSKNVCESPLVSKYFHYTHTLSQKKPGKAKLR